MNRIGGKSGGVVGERSPLEGDEVIGSGLPDPDVTEHLIWESRWSIRFNFGREEGALVEDSSNLCWS